MDFMEMLEKNEKSTTENGAVGFKTEGHKLVDLNFAIPSFRNEIDEHLFDMSLKEDEALTLKWLLYLRDARLGVGERASFRAFVLHLCEKYEDIAFKFLSVVPIEEYGRWDDYVYLYCNMKDSRIKVKIGDIIKDRLNKDLNLYTNDDNISLLAKWLPSINTSSSITRKMGKEMCKLFKMTPKMYRKCLSMLRKKLDIVERKISSNEWNSIEYDKVPSKANIIYKDAFYRHDSERRESYLDSVKDGTAKINANVLFLHDIVNSYFSWHRVKDYDETLEQLWKAQDKVEGFSDTLVVRDGSGSMGRTLPNSDMSILSIADAITLYCAENNSGGFKDKFITFSSNPRIRDVSSFNTLHDKLEYIRKYDDCTNTNIEAVFNLILETAVENKLPQSEIPSKVLVISDMEFDDIESSSDYWWADDEVTPTISKALFEELSKEFKEYGYKLPKLVFWNVNSRTNTIPITKNELGVTLLSGFSKNLMNMVMSSSLDPYDALVKELNSDRYSVVDNMYIW